MDGRPRPGRHPPGAAAEHFIARSARHMFIFSPEDTTHERSDLVLTILFQTVCPTNSHLSDVGPQM